MQIHQAFSEMIDVAITLVASDILRLTVCVTLIIDPSEGLLKCVRLTTRTAITRNAVPKTLISSNAKVRVFCPYKK